MKRLLLLSILACTCVISSFAQNTSTAPNEASYVGATGSKMLWVYGKSTQTGEGLFFRLNGWTYYKSNQFSIKDFDAHSGGVILLSTDDKINQFDKNSGQWFTQGGMTNVKAICHPNDGKAGCMAVGSVKQSDGTTKVGLYRSTTQTGWTLLSDASVCSSVIKLDAAQGSPSFPYVLTSSNRVLQFVAGNWQEISTGTVVPANLMIGENNKLYIADQQGTWYLYEAGQFKSTQFSASVATADMNGNLYGIVNGKIEALEDGVRSYVTVESVDNYDSNGNTKLTASALLSDENKMNSLLESGANPDLPNKNGDYALTIAASNNNLEMVNMLLESNANPNVIDNSGHCALQYAVTKGNAKIAQALLIAKADAGCDKVIEAAVQNDSKEMLLILSTYNADFTPGFEYAVSTGNTATFKTLLRYSEGLKSNGPFNKSVDINNAEMAELCLQNGANASEGLSYSLDLKNSSMIELCLKYGAQTDAAVQYSVDNTDETLARNLITTYKVDPNNVLARSMNYVPETKSDDPSNPVTDQTNPDMTNATDSQTASSPKPKHIFLQNPNLKIAEVALQSGAKPDTYVDPALADNNDEVVALLLKYNADPNIILSAAVKNSKTELADQALKNGAVATDPELVKIAVDSNNTEMTNLLLDAGAPATDPALMQSAVNHENTAIVSSLLTKGASATDSTLIYTAATKNNIDLVGMLVQYGSDPTYGMMPALNNNNTDMAVFLIDKGASPYNANFLSTAVAKGNKTVATKLVDKGANVDNGMKSAVEYNREDIFVYLVDKGANALKTDLVYIAVAKNHIQIFNRLMDLSAPVDYTGSNNENLLHVACRNQSYPVAKKLLDRGVKVNQKTSSGDTPLHFAADAGRNNVDLCKLLVDNGADVNATNNRGKSIYKVADGQKLKKYLKSKGAKK